MALSFQKRLLLGVLLLVILITTTLAFVAVQLSSAFLRSRFDDRMSFLARHLAINSELGILLGDQEMLKKSAANVLAENDVTMVWIEDKHGEIIYKEGKERTGKSIETVVQVLQREQEEDQAFIYNPERNKMLGKVHLVYSTAGIDSLLGNFRNVHIFVGTGAGAIGLLFFYFFSRSLVRPLKDLVNATKQVTMGDFTTHVKEGYIPEMQHLAHNFNNMLTALELNRKKLNDVHRQITEQKALAEVGLFSFTVAHEVKNPLGIIKGALDILKKPEVDVETKSTMIDYIEDEILRLNRLVQDFLDFSRPQKPNFQDIDLSNMVETIVERSKLEWEKQGILLHWIVTQAECKIDADADLLSQAIHNVLRNACQACRDKGEVEITATVSESSCILKISDTGKGMSAEVKARAFEPFFTTKANGTGLGLAFVDRVMRVHGGKISILDNKYGGTSFKLEFPRVTNS
jgi:signal transduction histidine kinase